MADAASAHERLAKSRREHRPFNLNTAFCAGEERDFLMLPQSKSYTKPLLPLPISLHSSRAAEWRCLIARQHPTISAILATIALVVRYRHGAA